MDCEEEGEAKLRKRRRRSVRNLRRISAIFPVNVNDAEESESEEKKDINTVAAEEDAMYGSLWLETEEPVRKRKKRRSSMYISLMTSEPPPRITLDDSTCESEQSQQLKHSPVTSDCSNMMQYNLTDKTHSPVHVQSYSFTTTEEMICNTSPANTLHDPPSPIHDLVKYVNCEGTPTCIMPIDSVSPNHGKLDCSVNNFLDNTLGLSFSSVSDNSRISLDLSSGFAADTRTPQNSLTHQPSPQSMSPEFPPSPSGLLYVGKQDDSYSTVTVSVHSDSVASPHQEQDRPSCSPLQDNLTDSFRPEKISTSPESLETTDMSSDKENDSVLAETNRTGTSECLENQSNTSLSILSTWSMCKTFAGKVVDFVKTSPSYLVDMISDSGKSVLIDSNSNMFASPQLKRNLVNESSNKVDCSKSEIDRLLTHMEQIENATGSLETDVEVYSAMHTFNKDSAEPPQTATKDDNSNDIHNTADINDQPVLSENGDSNRVRHISSSSKERSSSISSSAKKRRKDRQSSSKAFFDTFNAISAELNKDRSEELQTPRPSASGNCHSCKTPTRVTGSSFINKNDLSNFDNMSIEQSKEMNEKTSESMFDEKFEFSDKNSITPAAIEKTHLSELNHHLNNDYENVCLVTQRRKRLKAICPTIICEHATETEVISAMVKDPVNTNDKISENSNICRDKEISYEETYNCSASKSKKAKLSKQCASQRVTSETTRTETKNTSKESKRTKNVTTAKKARRRSATFKPCIQAGKTEQKLSTASDIEKIENIDDGKVDTEDTNNVNVLLNNLEQTENCISEHVSNNCDLNIDRKSQCHDTQNMEDKMSQLDICNTDSSSEENSQITVRKGKPSDMERRFAEDNVCSSENVFSVPFNNRMFAEWKNTSEIDKDNANTKSVRRPEKRNETDSSDCVQKLNVTYAKQNSSRSRKNNRNQKRNSDSLEDDGMVVDVIQDISEFQIKDNELGHVLVQESGSMDITANIGDDVCPEDGNGILIDADHMSTDKRLGSANIRGKEILSDACVTLEQMNMLSGDTETTTESEPMLTVNDITLPDDRPAPRRRRRQSADAATLKIQMLAEGFNISSPAEDSPNEGPTTAMKAKRKRKNEPEFSLEQIYLNKNYQKPEVKKWEPVLESPKDSNFHYGKKKMQTYVDFENPTQMKLKRRLQRAVKNGWDPKRRRRSILSDTYVQSKLENIWSSLDQSGSESLEEALQAIVETE